jgi:hypothetical protein
LLCRQRFIRGESAEESAEHVLEGLLLVTSPDSSDNGSEFLNILRKFSFGCIVSREPDNNIFRLIDYIMGDRFALLSINTEFVDEDGETVVWIFHARMTRGWIGGIFRRLSRKLRGECELVRVKARYNSGFLIAGKDS